MSEKSKILKHIEESTIHDIWFAFQKHMKEKFFQLAPNWTWSSRNHNKADIVQTKRKYKHIDLLKIHGWTAICWACEFIKNNPKVINCPVDDNSHASSDLLLIPHEDKNEYWGTTVMFIPQCNNEQGVFFLYPPDLSNLIKELQKIEKRQKEKPGRFGDLD